MCGNCVGCAADVRRSSRRRRVLADVSDFVVGDEEDSEDDYRPVRSTRRSVASRKKSKTTYSFSDEEEVDSEFYSDESSGFHKKSRKHSKHSRTSGNKKKKRKTTSYEYDSDFSASGVVGITTKRRSAAKQTVNYAETEDEQSDVDHQNRNKKKGKKTSDSDSYKVEAESETDFSENEHSSDHEQFLKSKQKKNVIESSDDNKSSTEAGNEFVDKVQTCDNKSPPTSFVFSSKNSITHLEKQGLHSSPEKNGKLCIDKLLPEDINTNLSDVDANDDDAIGDLKDVDLEGIGDIVEYITNE